jgi:hypothetical protein
MDRCNLFFSVRNSSLPATSKYVRLGISSILISVQGRQARAEGCGAGSVLLLAWTGQ